MPGPGEIKYDFAAIEQLKVNIDVKQRGLNDKLDQIKGAIAPLEFDWQGDDSAAYQVQQNQWNSAALELNLVLDSLAGAVGRGNEDMIRQEAVNRSKFQG